MSEEPTIQEFIQAATGILATLLRHLQFDDAQIESAFQDDQIFFQIETGEPGRLIGRGSRTLDAVQFLVNRLLSRLFDDSPYCVVDVDNNRERRREKLLADTAEALEHVRQTGQSWRMPLLNAMERRIIHQALKDCPDVATHSEDEYSDGRKRVVISLVQLDPPATSDDDSFEPTEPVEDLPPPPYEDIPPPAFEEIPPVEDAPAFADSETQPGDLPPAE